MTHPRLIFARLLAGLATTLLEIYESKHCHTQDLCMSIRPATLVDLLRFHIVYWSRPFEDSMVDVDAKLSILAHVNRCTVVFPQKEWAYAEPIVLGYCHNGSAGHPLEIQTNCKSCS